MKKIAVMSMVIVALAVGTYAQEKSLYDRLGGQPAIDAVVKDFGGRVLADTRINKKFAKSDANRLIKNLTDFVCVAAGGAWQDKRGRKEKKEKKKGREPGGSNCPVEEPGTTLHQINITD